jgi:hypothetical protein
MTKRSNETALPSAQRRMPQSVQNGHRDATGNGSETRSPESSSHGCPRCAIGRAIPSHSSQRTRIFAWMLENPMIVETLDGLEGADRYKALALMLDSARAKKVVLFNKETRETAGVALYQTCADTNRALSRREGRRAKGARSLHSGRPLMLTLRRKKKPARAKRRAKFWPSLHGLRRGRKHEISVTMMSCISTRE